MGIRVNTRHKLQPSMRCSDLVLKWVTWMRAICIDSPYFIAYVIYEWIRYGKATTLPRIAAPHEKAVLVLNGGSLANLSNEDMGCGDYFVCNEFCRSDVFTELCPSFYVLTDQQYYSGSITDTGYPVRSETLSVLDHKTSWDMTLFVPVEARQEGFTGRFLNPKIKIIYYSKAPLPGVGPLSRKILFCGDAMPYLSNVSVAMVAIAVKLGYLELDIYGLDMTFYRNFIVDSNNQSFIKNSYFYENEGLEPYKISSKKSGGYVRGNAAIFFLRMYQTLISHEQLEMLTRGIVRITNCSKDSVVDVYERRG